MSAVIGQSGALVAKLLQRPGQRLLGCSRQQYLRFRAQQTSFSSPVQRSFAWTAKTYEKRYTEDHEWIDTSNPESASVGISSYAAKALGDVVYVELPTIGLTVSKGDAIGAVESVKSASDIMTPVSGEVTEVNSQLEETPSLINKSPEGDGWLAKIKVVPEAGEGMYEWDSLMDASAYKKFTEEVDKKD